MRNIFINFFKIILSGSISLAILSGFCLVFDYSGIHVFNEKGSTDYKCESNQRVSNIKEGFSWIRFDENGFNNASDESFDEFPVNILLMGSSQMEAAQVMANESTASLLSEKMPEYRTYNIGMSSHRIYTCIQNLSAAVQEYKPSDYVIIETEYVTLDVDLMKQVVENNYPEIPTHDTGILYTIQKWMPAIKVLYNAIDNWIAASNWHSCVPVSEELNNINVFSEEYEIALDTLLKKARESVPSDCELIIFLQPTTEIDEKGNYKQGNTAGIELFDKLCKKHGIIFVDMTENFMELYTTRHILAHGFSNTAVGYGHLNKYGHQVIAATLASEIREEEQGK